MASPQQILANGRNAALSTGPRSADGKARSAANAMTHGATSRRLLIGEETQEQFDQFRTAVVEHYLPANEYESHLTETVALSAWRHQRILRLETEVLARVAADNAQQTGTAASDLAELFLVPAVTAPVRLVMRYLSSAARELRQAVEALTKVQEDRRARTAPEQTPDQQIVPAPAADLHKQHRSTGTSRRT